MTSKKNPDAKRDEDDSNPTSDETTGAPPQSAHGTAEQETSPPDRPSVAARAKSLAKRLGRNGVIIVVVVLAFVVGYLAHRSAGPGAPGSHTAHASQHAKKVKYWTCSMHPQIHSPKPGKCPICGMDLIPVESGSAAPTSNPRELHMSARARKLAEIEVTPVVRQRAAAEVRVVGKVAYDERRVGYITSWVNGRIDRLFVKFTGAKVRRYQPMVYIYSPELVTTQMELLQAVKLAKQLQGTSVAGVSATASATLEAARHKLRLLGLSGKQIARIEARGKPVDHLTLDAPVGGIVIEKRAQEQMYVKPGTRLYTIADLRRVWVKLDVYESDLGRVKKGDAIQFTTETYPGETFTGKVEFIDPFVDNRTRTVKVRLTVDNKDGRLKPDMFVRAVLESPIGADGKPLVAGAKESEEPLVIPVSAPLITGKRAVVYVEKKPGTYVGREVVLGARVGGYYVVREGLREGEKVVTQGNFKIDSALQIQAKPSMMNPDEPGKKGTGAAGAVVRRQAPAAFKAQLTAVTSAYYAVHQGLSRDKLDAAQKAARQVLAALKGVKMELLKGKAHLEWMADLKGLRSASQALARAADIKSARRDFGALSARLITTIRRFGLSAGAKAIRFHCTMAFDNKGADWIQPKAGVENPYFGSQMFRCGDEHESLLAPAVKRLAAPERFRRQLFAVVDAYYKVHDGLSHDNLAQAKQGAKQVARALKHVQMELLKGKAHLAWMKDLSGITTAVKKLARATSLKVARAAFSPLSDRLIAAVERFGVKGDRPVLLFHCPMAFDNKGADWIQPERGTLNPYYGSQMLTCGDQQRDLSASQRDL